MKERPILMNGPMVRATLRDVDPKTQTRRIVKPQPSSQKFRKSYAVDDGREYWVDYTAPQMMPPPPNAPGDQYVIPSLPVRIFCPYGQPSDRLFVRENWRRLDQDNVLGVHVQYEADGARRWIREGVRITDGYRPDRIVPSNHMPRWASRITLKVTGVRVERLQDITDADAEAEGVLDWAKSDAGMGFLRGLGVAVPDRPRFLFRLLWLGIHGAESWDASPYVWVVSFKRVEASR